MKMKNWRNGLALENSLTSALMEKMRGNKIKLIVLLLDNFASSVMPSVNLHR